MTTRFPWIIFAITLLPLGLGHTLFGLMATLMVALVLGLSLALGLMFVRLSPYGEAEWFQKMICRPFDRLCFASAERWFLAGVSAAFFLEAFALAYFSQGCVPTIQDSVAQLIEARLMLKGQVSLPAYPIGEFFDLGVMINDGRYYAQFPPGHSVLLALGLFLGAPCAVNPLLGALALLAVYALGRELYGARAGRIAALLGLVSPFMLVMSAEYMNHATTLLCGTLFLVFFLKAWRTKESCFALLAGAALSYVAITRPLTAAGIALPAGLWLLFSLRSHGRMALAVGLATLPALIFLGWYNLQTTGEWTVLGYQKLASNRFGFGPVPRAMWEWSAVTEHTLWHGIGMAFNSLNALHWFTFNWPASSLLFVPLAFLHRRMRREEGLLLAVCASLLLVHVPYYFQNWSPGPRFAYEMLGVIFVLTACGIERMPQLVAAWRGISPGVAQARLCFVLAGFILFAVSFSLWGLVQMPGRGEKLAALHRVEKIPEPTLLFVPFGEEYWRLAGQFYPVAPESRLVIAKDAGALNNTRLMRLYPNHRAVKAEHLGLPDERLEEIRR